VAIEWWLALAAAFLLLVAAAAGAVRLLRGSERWRYVVLGARLGAAVALAAALVAGGLNRAGWWAFDLWLGTLGLALATVVVQVALVWRCGFDGGGPMIDFAALGLILVAELAGQSGIGAGGCAQRAVLFWVSWAWLLLGVASLVVGASASLWLGLRHVSIRLGWKLYLPSGVEVHAFLSRATALALVALGGGLVVAAWWAWRLAGSMTRGEPQYAGFAAAWLVAAMGLLAWQLERHPGRWAAILLAVAAGVALLSLFAGPQLNPLLRGL